MYSLGHHTMVPCHYFSQRLATDSFSYLNLKKHLAKHLFFLRKSKRLLFAMEEAGD
jgi:hypothetical protein